MASTSEGGMAELKKLQKSAEETLALGEYFETLGTKPFVCIVLFQDPFLDEACVRLEQKVVVAWGFMAAWEIMRLLEGSWLLEDSCGYFRVHVWVAEGSCSFENTKQLLFESFTLDQKLAACLCLARDGQLVSSLGNKEEGGERRERWQKKTQGDHWPDVHCRSNQCGHAELHDPQQDPMFLEAHQAPTKVKKALAALHSWAWGLDWPCSEHSRSLQASKPKSSGSSQRRCSKWLIWP